MKTKLGWQKMGLKKEIPILFLFSFLPNSFGFAFSLKTERLCDPGLMATTPTRECLAPV
jgi:hypothetical protein